MSHNISTVGGKNNIAFLGSRKDVWHKLGQEMSEGMSIDQWADASGLNWEAILCPSYFQRDGQFHASGEVDVIRNDTNHHLGHVSERYKLVQPREILEWFQQYIGADDRFQLDVAGSLLNGEKIWATAKYNGDITVGGDAHKARLLMTTSFDGTGATINKMTMTRVVCNNTLDVALAGDKRAVVKTRHNTTFNAEKVGKELSNLAASVNAYKKMGDAMAEVHMPKEVVSLYFKKLLDIPFDVKKEDIATRKMNTFNELVDAYGETVKEGTQPETAWCALNAVTRFVDHSRGVRDTGNVGETEARFISSQFGSGAAMKDKAVYLLTADEEFAELLKRPVRAKGDDVSELLKQPLKTRVG